MILMSFRVCCIFVYIYCIDWLVVSDYNSKKRFKAAPWLQNMY